MISMLILTICVLAAGAYLIRQFVRGDLLDKPLSDDWTPPRWRRE